MFSFNSGKSPRLDEITSVFFRKFWSELKNTIMECVNQILMQLLANNSMDQEVEVEEDGDLLMGIGNEEQISLWNPPRTKELGKVE